jgi:RNA polymerase sigma-70 factor (ECF subfamily)
MGTPPPAADDDVEMHELTEKVQQAIAHLPDRTRQALVLHRQHGLSYAEVAAAMGISPRTVEVHIRRAFQALRISLDGLLLSLLLSVLLR